MKKTSIILAATIFLCMATTAPRTSHAALLSQGEQLYQAQVDIKTLAGRVDLLEQENANLQNWINGHANVTAPVQSVQQPSTVFDPELAARVTTLESRVNQLDQNLYWLGQQFFKLLAKLKIKL